MRFDDYQKLAKATERLGGEGDNPVVIALLGLAGEVGSVQTLYKKRLRDKDQFSGFRDKVREELGDILWYVTALATQEQLTLSEIANANIEKSHSRWLPTGDDDWVNFDDHFSPGERLPRLFVAEFRSTSTDGIQKVEIFVDGSKFGSTLNDNAYALDGYRFHDIFHMTCAALLGWSPVIRALLKRKRKSDPQIDEVEDGGRAIVTDEAVAAVVFSYAFKHAYLSEIKTLDWQLLDLCQDLTRSFEVAKRSTYEWEQTILRTFAVWRAIQENGCGWVKFDMDSRNASFYSSKPVL